MLAKRLQLLLGITEFCGGRCHNIPEVSENQCASIQLQRDGSVSLLPQVHLGQRQGAWS